MDHLPIGSIVELVLVDALVVLGLSAACGAMVARAAGWPLGRGIALGVVVPVAGPLAAGVVVTRRRRELGEVHRLSERNAPSYAAAAALGVAALAFLLGMFAPWGHLSGGYEKYSLAVEGSAVDTGALWVAWLLTAVLALLTAAVVLGWSPWRRLALLLVGVASVWLLVCLDAAIIFHAVEKVSDLVDGTSGGRASAEATPGAGLWLALVGAVVLVAGAMVLGFAPAPGAAAGAPAVRPATTAPPAWTTPTQSLINI
jgi:hypothetical protein